MVSTPAPVPGHKLHAEHLAPVTGHDVGAIRPGGLAVLERRRLARSAGVFYLLVVLLGGFAHALRLQFYVPGDATATATNIAANAALLRYGFVADLAMATSMLVLVWTLHRVLRHVDASLAQAMGALVVVGVAITCLNMVSQLGAVLVASDPAYNAAFPGGQADGLVLLLMDLQHHGYLVAQIFFGLWLVPLGLLAYRSGLFPRILAAALILAAPAHLLEVAVAFLAPELAAPVSTFVVVPIVVVAELSMMLYLLIRGTASRS